jgi:hypothetical protein
MAGRTKKADALSPEVSSALVTGSELDPERGARAGAPPAARLEATWRGLPAEAIDKLEEGVDNHVKWIDVPPAEGEDGYEGLLPESADPGAIDDAVSAQHPQMGGSARPTGRLPAGLLYLFRLLLVRPFEMLSGARARRRRSRGRRPLLVRRTKRELRDD